VSTRLKYAPTVAALALMLAGCGTAIPSSFETPQALLAHVQPPDNACDVSQYYYFHGACTRATLRSNGSTFRLKPYKGISLVAQVPANGGNNKPVLTFGDATGKGDITSNSSQPFPQYPNSCALPGTCVGKPLAYFLLNVETPHTLALKANSKLVVTYDGAFSSTCKMALLTSAGWNVLPYRSHIVGHKIVFSFDIHYAQGPVSFTVFCE
jgi:hypothetical protein